MKIHLHLDVTCSLLTQHAVWQQKEFGLDRMWIDATCVKLSLLGARFDALSRDSLA